MKTLIVHCVFSLRISVSAHDIITSIYGAWHACKPLFGSSVATCWLAYSDISISINEKKVERSPGKSQTWHNLAGGVTALAQLFALYSDKARFFKQWQRALHPNFIINHCSFHIYWVVASIKQYNLADGVTALAQLYALYYDRARSFNQ